MINIAICEDDRRDRELLKEMVTSVAKKLYLDCRVSVWPSGEALMKAVVVGHSYDLLILDIWMAQMTGLETAKAARKALPRALMGFVTGSPEFAVDAFELEALHYLVKPVTESAVEKLLQRFLERIGRPEPVIEIKTPRGEIPFVVADVQKIESYKKGVAVYLRGQEMPVQLNVTFTSVAEQLDRDRFIQIARGLLVNMDYIDHMERGVCYFNDGTSALVSRRECTKVQKRYNDYLFTQMKVMREIMDER